MEDLSDVEYFRVEPNGELVELDDFPENSDEVYVIVENNQRKIFLWKGLDAGVRQKFIGSRATGDKRKERGYHYKIIVMDQDDEHDEFIQYVRGGEPAESAAPIQSADKGKGDDDSTMSEEEFSSYAEAAEAQGIDISDEEVRRQSGEEKAKESAPSHIAKMGGVGARPQKSFLSDPNLAEDVAKDKVARKKVSGALQKTSKKEAKELVNALESPKGFDREMVIVGSQVYRVKIEDTEVELEDLENPLDGVIMVREYTPRILAENGEIKAVELLRQISEEVDLDESLTQDLEDLTSMFQIEIE